VQSGKGPMEALMVMVPEAYRGQPALDDRQEVVDFYQYWEAQQEAWDGPALLVWSDGKKVRSG
jgi:glutamate synthase (ferredoxin)